MRGKADMVRVRGDMGRRKGDMGRERREGEVQSKERSFYFHRSEKFPNNLEVFACGYLQIFFAIIPSSLSPQSLFKHLNKNKLYLLTVVSFFVESNDNVYNYF